MSSTNRSAARSKERKVNQDYYVTPKWAVREFMLAWNENTQILSYLRNPHAEAMIMDPCAGGDINNDMTYPKVLGEWGIQPLTMDIREDSRAMVIADYLVTDVGEQFDLIITNPPFNIAQDIIEKALTDCADDGFVVMLLRLNFLGGQARAPWLKQYMPSDIYVHTKRMGFNPEKPSATDSIEYAHFIWIKGETPGYARTHTIIHDSKNHS